MPIDPVTGAALIGLGGDILGGIFGSSAQKKANKANIQLQRENQAWLKDMSSTAYQRSTQDMIAAGLNPMLGFSQGGASTPGSSAATVEPNMAMSRATSSAATKAMQVAQIQLTSEQARKTKVEADFGQAFNAANIPELAFRSTQESNRMSVEVDKALADIAQLEKQGKATDAQAAQLREQANQIREMLPSLKAASETEAKIRQYQVPSAAMESRLISEMEAGRGSGTAGGFLMDLYQKINALKKGN
ncbi:MAG: DNA pilot protein [Arizlama microvirus]|nr:MAG: DNA pilot protein [Arizlama microvirus]